MKTPAASTLDPRFVYLTDKGAVARKRQIGLIPGAAAPVLTLELPPALRGQAREQVARRQILDRFGLGEDDVDMWPFVLSSTDNAGAWTKVLIADSASVADWRERAGTQAKTVLPDYLALPTAQDLWTLHQTRDNTIAVRLGPDDGFSATPDMALRLLKKRLGKAPKAALSIGALDPAITDLLNDHKISVVTQTSELPALGVSTPKSLGHDELTANLLRDPQMARTTLRRRVLPWRWPLLFGALAAGLWSASSILETQRIDDRTRAITVQTQDVVRANFVPAGPILDVRSQVSRALASMRAATEETTTEVTTLELFGRASEVIAQSTAFPELITATQDKSLTIILRVDDFAAADRIADALRDVSLNVEIVESRVSDSASGVRTELNIRDGAAQ